MPEDKPEQKPASPPPPAAGEKPAAAAPPKPAAPAKPAGPTPQPWESEMVARLRGRYGSGIDPKTYLGQNYIVADPSIVYELLQILRDDEQFDYCVDVTAVHYPQRKDQEFDIVWILYSFEHNQRVRVKAMIKDGDPAPSVVALWSTANWLERECFDMFGTRFEGHPDLRRILLPDGWKGHPLRKEYGITQQDTEWVKINLGIESGQ
ncbi:MAG: NADH-quinone oxidoreductase subunit C [Terriglobales bacterium]